MLLASLGIRLLLMRRACAEYVGTALLLLAIIGSGIAAHVRSSPGLWLGEACATFGLVLVVFGVVRSGRLALLPVTVGAYIAGAYFFTSSTSFANPAVSLARMLSNTFTGIAPGSVAAFIGFQLAGAAVAYGLIRLLWPGAAVGQGGSAT